MKSKLKIVVLFAILSLVGFSSCVKQDVFISWKVMNDEWLDAFQDKTTSIDYDWSIEIFQTPLLPDVIVDAPSGLRYRKLRHSNDTDKKPNPTSSIWAAYEGKLIDGTTFDKSEEASLGNIGNQIAGFSEILMKMHIGEVYEIYVPWELGYGDKGMGKIPPYSNLIFRLQLLDAVN